MNVSTKLSLPAFMPTYEFLMSYDYIVVAFSGGKDSLASVLFLLELGIPAEKIELHHHLVDGEGPYFMDWPITSAYCQAVADLLGMKLIYSYREGGFYREMMRDGVSTAPTKWQDIDGNWHRGGGKNVRLGRRLKFPQVTSNLNVRWCSPYLKIMVMDMLLANDPRFRGKQTLVITGERAQESRSRAGYAQFEAHRADNRDDPYRDTLRPKKRRTRHIDHWRPVHTWKEENVWGIIESAGIIPHPAYKLGWGRLSCMSCIFGSADQWATIRYLYPERFEQIFSKESEFGVTIRHKENVVQTANRGTPYPAAIAQPELAEFANQSIWTGPVFTNDWKLPAGAYGDQAGPC